MAYLLFMAKVYVASFSLTHDCFDSN